MERTKLLTVAVVGLLLLNLATVAFSWLHPNRPPHPERHSNPPPVGGPAMLIIERLHFDEQQQRQYLLLVDRHQQQMKVLNEQSAHLYGDYYDLLKAAQPDSIQASKLSEQIATNQQAIARINLAHFSQIKALCRTDQQAHFNRLVDDLAKLFNHQARPGDSQPLEGPPQNFAPHP